MIIISITWLSTSGICQIVHCNVIVSPFFLISSLEANHKAWLPHTGGITSKSHFHKGKTLLTLCTWLLHKGLSLLSCTTCCFAPLFLGFYTFYSIQVFSYIPLYLLFRFLYPKFCISFQEVALKMPIYLATLQLS